MSVSITQPSKSSVTASLTNKGGVGVTWNDENITWDNETDTWDTPGGGASMTQPTKDSASLSLTAKS